MTTKARRAMRVRIAAGVVLAAGVFGLFGPTATAIADPDPTVESSNPVSGSTRDGLKTAVKQRITQINRHVTAVQEASTRLT